MNLEDDLFIKNAEEDIKYFIKSEKCKRPSINADIQRTNFSFTKKSLHIMGIENQYIPPVSSEHIVHKTRNVRPIPSMEIYRPPAVRRAGLKKSPIKSSSPIEHLVSEACIKTNRQKRPDRAVYVPRHRRSILKFDSGNVQENDFKPPKETLHFNLKPSFDAVDNDQLSKKVNEIPAIVINTTFEKMTDQVFEERYAPISTKREEVKSRLSPEIKFPLTNKLQIHEKKEDKFEETFIYQTNCNEPDLSFNNCDSNVFKDRIDSLDSITLYQPNALFDDESVKLELNVVSSPLKIKNKSYEDNKMFKQTLISEVLIISSGVDKAEIKSVKPLVPVINMTVPEKKVKKVERPKSKPALPPVSPSKINRDDCDWDSLFDDNGDCLDPKLIEELTSAVGEVVIEKPKCSYKTYTPSFEMSSDEFAHVLEIYNFPSEFKSSDLAAIFSQFKNDGFELKWVDDTHCLGVFSSPLVAAEVLASDHPFVKTRPLCEATTLSKTKARRSSEFLQPYKSRPETCAALARRLVTKSLGVTLSTARQEREQEKIVLREAKEKRRLANKQREDVWEGIITEKPIL